MNSINNNPVTASSLSAVSQSGAKDSSINSENKTGLRGLYGDPGKANVLKINLSKSMEGARQAYGHVEAANPDIIKMLNNY